jgi:hypothetical protein
MESRQVATRRGQALTKEPSVKKEELKPSINSIRETILNIESLYTDSGLALSREWDFKATRDIVLD